MFVRKMSIYLCCGAPLASVPQSAGNVGEKLGESEPRFCVAPAKGSGGVIRGGDLRWVEESRNCVVVLLLLPLLSHGYPFPLLPHLNILPISMLLLEG